MEQEKILKIKGSTDTAVKELLTILPPINQIKKITMFQYGVNFWLTEYLTDLHTHFVLEKKNGERIDSDGINCGYPGTGPRGTEKIFDVLGISEKYPGLPLCSSGFSLSFADENIKLKDNITFFYEDNKKFGKIKKYGFCTNAYSEIHYDSRKIYLIEPQIHNFTGMLNLIQVMKPYHFSFYIGNESPLDNQYRIYRPDFKNTRMKFGGIKAHGVNMVIKGNVFDICCLIDKDTIIPFSNVIYQYIFHEPLNHMLSADTNTLYDSMQPFLKKLYAAIRLLFTGRKTFIYSEEIKDRKNVEYPGIY